MIRGFITLGMLLIGFFTIPTTAHAQFLEQQLLRENPADLIAAAEKFGDAKRGAIAFFQPYMACTKCHATSNGQSPLGPDLAKFEEKATPAHLLESILYPSKKIRKGYDGITIITVEGKSLSGILVKETDAAITIKDASRNGEQVTIPLKEIEERSKSAVSIMPKGLTNQLISRQQFLDLFKYLMEISTQGPSRAAELEPPPSLYANRPLPEYEAKIDHRGMIESWDNAGYKRGEAIYNRLCINCHGTKDTPGSLPTSLRFAKGKFKNGSDPFSMYQTITRGFGMMVPQTWMVPQQKYDVIHYIREAYLKPHNPSQYFNAETAYLAGLPKGDTKGPAPKPFHPWSDMDYGNTLVHTYEVGEDGSNFAYKGIAVRLDEGPGGIARGRHWMVFDHDTLRVAAGWSGTGFIDWQGIMLNGRHAIHPRIMGDVQFANPTGPGWANPANGSFKDPRFLGRDERPYGPLPREWAHYKGLYHYGQRAVISYTVGKTSVLESEGLNRSSIQPVMTRTFNIGPRDRDMILQVARHAGEGIQLSSSRTKSGQTVLLHTGNRETTQNATPKESSNLPLTFDGNTYVEIKQADQFQMHDQDFTITARIKTKSDGTIFSQTFPGPEWKPDGKTFFIRGGRLAYDIGWVGAIQSQQRVNDGRWHNVALTYSQKTKTLQFFVDGKPDKSGSLQPKATPKNHVMRIGFTSPNFPRTSGYKGEMESVRFYQRALSAEELQQPDSKEKLVANWNLKEAQGETVANLTQTKLTGKVVATSEAAEPTQTSGGNFLAGLSPEVPGCEFLLVDGNLRLKIPAGTAPLKFTLWQTPIENQTSAQSLQAKLSFKKPDEDLSLLTKGSSPKWPETLKTVGIKGSDEEPYAVDVFTRPASNPWLARVRFTGFDFLPDGNRVAICTWDGDVWMVEGVLHPEQGLSWKRIACGLFQPLGLKYIDGKIYLTCRDQLTILHDLNNDGETDFYESFNNDHQVTEHFHEFAMGLQTDADGNFYYAKSARHAKTALVPHHGTLLKVSKDGSTTEIIANGFRAANGVCLNPDGTFIVTDQEGHWNPKNRINYVKKGGFYGNMFGYHDVTDSSDEAMQQPLCWITNSFDRSPAELLWVDSKKWGPLEGSLLNLSYGYGKVYVVPHEKIDGQAQGGMCELPLPQFPTGVMRGRFSPVDGQLYTCGMFAWAGSQQQPGGFYRIRYTGKSVYLPVKLNAQPEGMQITFTGKLDPATILAENFQVKTWDLKRTAGYGSKHYNERPLKVESVELTGEDTVIVKIPDLKPTWGMEIRYSLKGADGKVFQGTIHNTIHQLSD